MGRMAVTTAVPVMDLVTIRKALQGVLGAHRGTSKRAMEAVRKARDAYRPCFSMEESQRGLKAGQRQQREAPAGHFLWQVPQYSSFEGVLEGLGTQFIDEVREPLGSQ